MAAGAVAVVGNHDVQQRGDLLKSIILAMTFTGALVLWPHVAVKSVRGLHEGKCGPKRTAQVQAVLQSLTANDVSHWRYPCNCVWASREQVETNILHLERASARQSKLERRQNLIVIELQHVLPPPMPFLFPATERPRDVTRLMVDASIVANRPTHSYAYFSRPRPAWWKGTKVNEVYLAWMIRDDPFHLARGECGITAAATSIPAR